MLLQSEKNLREIKNSLRYWAKKNNLSIQLYPAGIEFNQYKGKSYTIITSDRGYFLSFVPDYMDYDNEIKKELNIENKIYEENFNIKSVINQFKQFVKEVA